MKNVDSMTDVSVYALNRTQTVMFYHKMPVLLNQLPTVIQSSSEHSVEIVVDINDVQQVIHCERG